MLKNKHAGWLSVKLPRPPHQVINKFLKSPGKDAPHVLAKTEGTAKVEKVHAQVNTSLSAALSANMSKVEYPCGDSAKV